MLVRVITSVVAFLVFLPFLVHSDTMAFPIIMGLAAAVSVYELIRCVGLHKKPQVTLPLCFSALAMPIAIRILPDDNNARSLGLVVLMVLMFYLYAVTIFSRGTIDITQASTVLMVSFYITTAFTGMVFLRDMCGEYIYLLAFIGAWVPDTFAYFTGRLFGKHKLIPDVSPKKTVEGAIGGVVFCVIAFVIFGLVFNHLTACACDGVCTTSHPSNLPIWLMAVLGFLSAIVSMIGDLAMSVIKRHYGIKDYGKILPGHGGLLDRFDSVIAVAVILSLAFGIVTHAGVM